MSWEDIEKFCGEGKATQLGVGLATCVLHDLRDPGIFETPYNGPKILIVNRHQPHNKPHGGLVDMKKGEEGPITSVLTFMDAQGLENYIDLLQGYLDKVREDTSKDPEDVNWATCGSCGWWGLNSELPRDDGESPHPCGKDKCPECGDNGCICCCIPTAVKHAYENWDDENEPWPGWDEMEERLRKQKESEPPGPWSDQKMYLSEDHGDDETTD